MNILKTLILIFTMVVSTNIFAQVKSIDSERLAKMFEGSYSNERQAKNDSKFSDLRIHIKRIWTDRTDEKWLYFEKSYSSKPEEPIVQQVYKIKNTYEGRFEITEYDIMEPSRFVGEWKSEYPLTSITPDSLVVRNGCSIILTLMNDGGYEGGRKAKNCSGENEKVKYITSEVILTDVGLMISETGFDENDKKVNSTGKYYFSREK